MVLLLLGRRSRFLIQWFVVEVVLGSFGRDGRPACRYRLLMLVMPEESRELLANCLTR